MVDSSPVFPHSKSSFSIPRLAWGVIVQGFIRIVRMVLEIPVASKLGTPRYFAPQASCNWEPQFVADHINGPIEKLYRRTMEPCTTTKTTTIIGRRLTSEQYQLGTEV